MTSTKPVRVMRARRSGLVGCGHYVLTGAAICKVGDKWICLDCRLSEVRELASSTKAVS